MNETNQEGWLSIGEAAKLLRVSKDTLRRWEKQGIIKAHRSPTNRRYYKKQDLDYVFSKKPDLIEKPSEKETSLPAKKESQLSLVIASLLTIYIVLMIFLAFLLLRAG
ncbi:MAG: MerR family DNA-binding transcriptional regulator [Patescibacteria group bacterium]